MGINEIYKLLDNNEVLVQRLDVPVSTSVFAFINILFRQGADKTFALKVTHDDILRLVFSTEFKGYVEDKFEKVFIKTNSTIPENYWPDVYVLLRNNKDVVKSTLAFYRKVFARNGQGELYRFLEEQWNTHRNIVFQLAALVTLHLLGIELIKDTLC